MSDSKLQIDPGSSENIKSRINAPKTSTPKHIIFKLQKIKDNVLKEARGKTPYL